MDTSSKYFFDISSEEKELLVLELSRLFVFNLLVIADHEDEGGIGHPLESTHTVLQPIITSLMNDGLICIEPYDGGEEYVPTSKSKDFISDLIKETEQWKSTSAEGLDQIKKAFYLGIDNGSLKHINENERPWYHEITRFKFYESLIPPPTIASEASESTSEVSSEGSAIHIQEKAKHYPFTHYLFKKPTFIWLGLTLVSFLLTQTFSSFFWWLPLIGSILATIYFGALKVSVGSEGLFFKSLLGNKQIDIKNIDELVYAEEDGSAQSLEILGNQGQQIKVSKWMDDFNGFKHYLETIKDDPENS